MVWDVSIHPFYDRVRLAVLSGSEIVKKMAD